MGRLTPSASVLGPTINSTSNQQPTTNNQSNQPTNQSIQSNPTDNQISNHTSLCQVKNEFCIGIDIGKISKMFILKILLHFLHKLYLSLFKNENF